MGFFKSLVGRLAKKQPDLVKEIKKVNAQQAAPLAPADRIKYEVGLDKSSKTLADVVNQMAARHRKVDEPLFDDLQKGLIAFDVGPATARRIANAVKQEVAVQGIEDPALIKEVVLDTMVVDYIDRAAVTTDLDVRPGRTNVIVVVGVNGSGKTTTIAKLAKRFKDQGLRVLIVAADTFRAGAVAQLAIWAERVGADIVKPTKDGQDPSSVVFDGVKQGAAGKYDVVICDTAGRLQNKVNLMNELKKTNAAITRFIPGAPHETLLVLDGSTGQSGLAQAQGFSEVARLTGIVLTKMDGTAKGGIVLAIKDAFALPVKLIGFGEGLADLKPFDLEAFVDGLTKDVLAEHANG